MKEQKMAKDTKRVIPLIDLSDTHRHRPLKSSFPLSEFIRDFSSLDAEGRATRVEPVTFDYSAEQTLAI